MYRLGMIVCFTVGGLSLLAVTFWASRVRPIWDNGHLLIDPWFQATLLDAYLGFLTIGLWMVYRESCWWRRVIWLLAFLLLGNLAIAAYLIMRLVRWVPAQGVSGLLLNERDQSPSHSGVEQVRC